jgi:uncharacterized protein YecT (DUF1311 family)
MPFLGMTLALLCLAASLETRAAGVQGDTCWDSAKAQLELNQCAALDLEAADADMNAVYKQVVAHRDATFIKRLRIAQRAWLAFRDAHVDTIYGLSNDGHGGSMLPMCVARLRTELTLERTKQLRLLLEPHEGDVCGAGAD